jgi:hypothetical protein
MKRNTHERRLFREGGISRIRWTNLAQSTLASSWLHHIVINQLYILRIGIYGQMQRQKWHLEPQRSDIVTDVMVNPSFTGMSSNNGLS